MPHLPISEMTNKELLHYFELWARGRKSVETIKAEILRKLELAAPSPAQGTPEPPKLEVDARQYESALKVWHAAVKKFTLPNEMPDADTLAAKISALAGPQNGQGWAEDAAMEIIRTLRPSDPHSWDANLPYVMARLESLSTVTGEARGCPMFYGPHECDLCAQKNIVRGSVKDGFGDLRFDWPVNEPFIYPNYIWRKHICGEAVKP